MLHRISGCRKYYPTDIRLIKFVRLIFLNVDTNVITVTYYLSILFFLKDTSVSNKTKLCLYELDHSISAAGWRGRRTTAKR